MKKYIIILATIISTVACSHTEMDVEQEYSKTRFTAILEDAIATKTYLGEEEDGMYPVYWSEGDKIKMLVSQHEISDGQGYQLDLESGAGTIESVFSGNVPALPEGSLYYYAVYPYSLAASIGGRDVLDYGISPAEEAWDTYGDGSLWEASNYVLVSLPSVQQYAPHSFGRDYNPAIAVSRDQTLRFKNPCGVLRINLTGNVKVGKITVRGDGDAALWGVLLARYRWRQRSSESEFMSFVASGQSYSSDRRTITLDCGSGVQLSNEVTDFYIVLPISGNSFWDGGDFYDFKFSSPLCEGFTMRVYDTLGNEVYAKHTDMDNSIHRSMIRNMPVLDVRTQSLTDLSINGTANSYIVSPDGGSYSFYAGNRGNSPQPVVDNMAVFQNATAEVLWETRMSGSVATNLNDIVDNVRFDTETRYISFSSTHIPGNALIALKDAADNILWSWHIWSTDYNPNATGSTDMYGSVEMMDRNLGALHKEWGNVDFYGLYYQWGRKDPFDAGYDMTERKFLFYPSSPFSSVSVGKTVDQLTRIPTTYVFTVGDLYAATGLELSLSEIAELWGKEKTQYDPCPPGWQVADFDTYYQFASSFSNPNFGTTDEGDFALFTRSNPDAVYPKEELWTNLHHQSFWGAISFRLGSFSGGQYSSNLKHVRCQRSSTPIDVRPVIDLSANGTANCYIARPNKRYKFNASVKGSSNISTGMPANAIIQVYTENTTEIHGTQYGGLKMEDGLITDCYIKDGYIYFTTSLDDVYGNAIIILKNPRGQVIWSWHIWIVDYNPNSDYDTVDWGEAGNAKFMKMNLGALNNEMYDSRAMGMMYQWGRKDPFMGAAAYDSNSQARYEGEYDYVAASDEYSTLLYSLQNPYKAIMDSVDGDGDWLAEHENTLWGEEKTPYDPCPPGWKVPSRPVFSEKTVTSVYQYGLQMDGIWYPATGFHHSVSFNLNKVGSEGHYWYATPKDDGHAYSFFFDSDNETVDLVNHYTPKAQLNAIRCMKDEMIVGIIETN